MKVAIIGCGVMGTMHADMARHAGFEIDGFYDPNLSATRAAVRRFGGKLYRTAQAAIDSSAEVVAIATPTPTHAAMIVGAAKSGKQIFCEKPLARTVAEANRAIQAAETAKVKLFAGHVVRYFHEFETLRAHAQSGRIGRVGFIRTFRGGACPGGRGNWFRDFKQSGGAALDLLIHDIDWIRFAFGEVRTVFCQNLMRTKPAPMDYAMATLTLESGTIAQLIGSWAHPEGFRVKAELCGTHGMLTYDSADAPITVMPRNAKGGEGGAIIPASPVVESPYLLEWKDFAGWVKGIGKPRISARDALASLAVAEAALASAKSGKAVNFSGAKRKAS